MTTALSLFTLKRFSNGWNGLTKGDIPNIGHFPKKTIYGLDPAYRFLQEGNRAPNYLIYNSPRFLFGVSTTLNCSCITYASENFKNFNPLTDGDLGERINSIIDPVDIILIDGQSQPVEKAIVEYQFIKERFPGMPVIIISSKSSPIKPQELRDQGIFALGYTELNHHRFAEALIESALGEKGLEKLKINLN